MNDCCFFCSICSDFAFYYKIMWQWHYEEYVFHTFSWFLVISPEMTCKSVHPFICPSGVNIFKTLQLRDHWADVDEAWQVYSVGPGTNFYEVEIWILAHAPRRTDDPPRPGWLIPACYETSLQLLPAPRAGWCPASSSLWSRHFSISDMVFLAHCTRQGPTAVFVYCVVNSHSWRCPS